MAFRVKIGLKLLNITNITLNLLINIRQRNVKKQIFLVGSVKN